MNTKTMLEKFNQQNNTNFTGEQLVKAFKKLIEMFEYGLKQLLIWMQEKFKPSEPIVKSKQVRPYYYHRQRWC